jgi:hypothetical protein
MRARRLQWWRPPGRRKVETDRHVYLAAHGARIKEDGAWRGLVQQQECVRLLTFPNGFDDRRTVAHPRVYSGAG